MAADSAEEAVALLARHRDRDARVLAGGQSLVPLLAMRLAAPGVLVDVSRAPDLSGVAVHGGELVVGAATRQRAVERSAVVARTCPLLAEAMPLIGHDAIRTRGTVGGSLAHGDPAAELPLVAVTLGVRLDVRGTTGVRTVDADDFFTGYFTTALADGEVLVAARFPVARAGEGAAIVELSRRHGDFAVVAAAAFVRLVAGAVEEVRLGLGGIAPVPLRITADMTREAPTGALWRDIAGRAAITLDPPDDLHGPPDYRRHLAAVLAERALAAAAARAAAGTYS